LPTLLELVRLSVRLVQWAHIVSPSYVMNADGHRAAKSRSLLALRQSLTGVLCGLRYHQSVELRSQRVVRKPGVFRARERSSFSFLSPETPDTNSQVSNEDAIFGPRIAAETCGKKDGVNSSACQDVTRRRGTRPE